LRMVYGAAMSTPKPDYGVTVMISFASSG